MIKIMRRYVKEGPPWYWDHDGTGNPPLICLCCGVTFTKNPLDWDTDLPEMAEDETLHNDGCTWRLAKEYLANLENEGY